MKYRPICPCALCHIPEIQPSTKQPQGTVTSGFLFDSLEAPEDRTEVDCKAVLKG